MDSAASCRCQRFWPLKAKGFLTGDDLFLKQEDTRLEEGPVPVDEGVENVSADEEEPGGVMMPLDMRAHDTFDLSCFPPFEAHCVIEVFHSDKILI